MMAFTYSGAGAEEVNAVLAQLTDAFTRNIGLNLKGLYLHGSMAMGCFRPWSSDIDLLAVVFAPMQREAKLKLVADVMGVAEGGSEFRKFELSVVTADEAARAVHPIQYILHYSNTWHQAYKDGNAELVIAGGDDADLAAHLTVINQRGVTLYGAPIRDTFGQILREDYLKAVWYDIASAENDAQDHPMYTVLSLCRTLAYLETGHVASKLEGGRWAAGLPELRLFLPVIEAAIDEYTSGEPGHFEPEMLTDAVSFMMGIIRPQLA